MSTETGTKVSASHLARTAYLYVRQSTLRQVMENTESTQRQYALRQRAVALGWPTEAIVTIDSDQGQSGASSADRDGPQQCGLAPPLGDLRAQRHSDLRRGRSLQPLGLQRPAALGLEGNDVRGRAALH